METKSEPHYPHASTNTVTMATARHLSETDVRRRFEACRVKKNENCMPQ